MTAEEALSFFENLPKIRQKVQTLVDVGLGYVKLGQSSTNTLRRRSAARKACNGSSPGRATGRTIYILDEPTTGLHMADVHRLIDVLQRLVDTGNTVLVIEHNLDVIKTADYVLDLGPEGGSGGGTIVCQGTPRGHRRLQGKLYRPVSQKASEIIFSPHAKGRSAPCPFTKVTASACAASSKPAAWTRCPTYRCWRFCCITPFPARTRTRSPTGC